jgi:DNA-binding response OmpR family regulator
MRILLVEDDEAIVRVLKSLLSSYNYAVDAAADGQVGLEMAEAFEYDLVLLDVKLPKLDGISLCQKLRAQGYRMPILLLTGLNGAHEKAAALNLGADDYVVKPFNAEELLARIQALLRRGEVTTLPVLQWGKLRLDPSSCQVTYDSKELPLTPKEYALLELLLRHSQQVLSPEKIIEHVWTSEDAPGGETIRSHIKGLRRKLQLAGAPFEFIETVYGVGYRLKPLATPALFAQIEHPAMAPHTPNAPEAELPGKSQPINAQPKVMVVAEDSQLLGFLKGILEAQNLTAIALTDARQFWQALEADRIDLLVLDVEMAGISAIELCQLLRQTARWQKLPILLLIPNTEATLVHQVFAAGANDFVSKPIVGPELITRIASRLN